MTTLATKHPGELTLRRFLAEEALDLATTEHLRGCVECSARLGKLKEEQKAFEAEVSFERFAAGVERAARQVEPARRRRPWVGVAVALAVGFSAVVSVRQVQPTTRIKGGESVNFVIEGPGGQRPAGELEQLASGDRVRIGVSGHRHVLTLSIDDAGEVSMVYLETMSDERKTWLPDSIEFTGKGREHLVVLLADSKPQVEPLSLQLQERFQASKGDLTQLRTLDFDGVQVHRTFLKP